MSNYFIKKFIILALKQLRAHLYAEHLSKTRQ